MQYLFKTLCIYDTYTFKELYVIQESRSIVTWLSNNVEIITCNRQGVVALCNIDNGSVKYINKEPYDCRISTLDLSFDETKISVYSGNTNTTKVWEINTGKFLMENQDKGWLSKDGKWIISYNNMLNMDTKEIIYFDNENSKCHREQIHKAWDNKVFRYKADDSYLELWDTYISYHNWNLYYFLYIFKMLILYTMYTIIVNFILLFCILDNENVIIKCLIHFLNRQQTS